MVVVLFWPNLEANFSCTSSFESRMSVTSFRVSWALVSFAVYTTIFKGLNEQNF